MFVWPLLVILVGVRALLFLRQSHYRKGDRVELLLNKVESDHTQLPYRYHDLPFVCYDKTKKPKLVLLGLVFNGDRFWELNYDLRFGEDRPCVQLCMMRAKPSGLRRAADLIKNGYVVHWLLDDLPGATTFVSGRNMKYYAAGFPLGFIEDGVAYLYNHVLLVVRFNTAKDGSHSIVGFEVYPKSVDGEACPGALKQYHNLPLHTQEELMIPYTYSVYWREDNSVAYENRWDLYLSSDSSKALERVHWLLFVNSLVLVLLVSVAVAITMVRVLRTDINDVRIPLATELGWRSLAGSVFQRPVNALLLVTLCAAGIQLLITIILVLAALVLDARFLLQSSFFNSHQGAIALCSITVILALGSLASFCGIILHKVLFNVPGTKYSTAHARYLGCIFAGSMPAFVLAVVLLLNMFVWAKELSNALPFGTIVVLVLLLLVELPLGILGSLLGNRMKLSLESLASLPAPKPRRTFVMNPVVTTVVFGGIPFVIVYVDLLLILNLVWLEKTSYYYMYGFFLVTLVLLVVVIAESSVVVTYLILAVYNNARWQWLCFQASSSLGWWVFAYSAYYFASLQMSDVVSVIFYFAYMGLVSVVIGVASGAVGLVAGYIFVRTMYRAVKVD